ncbi:MAG: cystatin domain-containing protein [Pyrinomonadaceae bacterium]
MKKLSIALGLVALFACAAAAQKVGGYKAIEASDAGVQEAAEFAVSAEAEKTNREVHLISIAKAEVQIVAGRNYRLCMKVRSQGGEDEADAIIFVQAVVYVDLKNNKKLSTWGASDCGDDDD